MHDIESALHLMLLAPSRRDLFEFQVSKLSAGIHWAQPNLAFVQNRLVAPELVEAFAPLIESFGDLADAIGELAGNRPLGKATYWLIESVKAEIEARSNAILIDSADLSKHFDQTASTLNTEQWALWQTATKSLDDAISDLGLERQELYRDARTHLNDLIAQPSIRATATMWLILGWLSWKRRIYVDDVVPLFENAARASSSSKNLIYWLSCRHLAYLQEQQGLVEASLISIKSALQAQADGQTLMEAFRYAFLSGNPAEAVLFAKRCIQASPLHAIPIFAMLEAEA